MQPLFVTIIMFIVCNFFVLKTGFSLFTAKQIHQDFNAYVSIWVTHVQSTSSKKKFKWKAAVAFHNITKNKRLLLTNQFSHVASVQLFHMGNKRVSVFESSLNLNLISTSETNFSRSIQFFNNGSYFNVLLKWAFI